MIKVSVLTDTGDGPTLTVDLAKSIGLEVEFQERDLPVNMDTLKITGRKGVISKTITKRFEKIY